MKNALISGMAALAVLVAQGPARADFATGGAGGSYLTGTLWNPPRAADGRLYIEDINALPANAFVRLAGSKLKTNIDSAYAAVGRSSLKNGVYGSFDYSGMAWDNGGKRGWAFGGGHATSGSNGIHKLDVAKGKWVPEVYESYPGYNGYTQNDNDFLMKSTNENYTKGLFVVKSGDLTGLHDSGAVVVNTFAEQSPQLYVRPFARSSTGFAVKIQGNPWGTAWVEAPGPEGFVTTQAAYDAIFPNPASARPQIKTTWGTLWDGPMTSWHTYYFQTYVPNKNMFLVSAYGNNYWAHLDGSGWASLTDPEYAPFNSYLSINSWGGLSASRLVYDSTRNKLWFGSHTGNNTGYWYTDRANMIAMGYDPDKYWFWANYLLSYDLDTRAWSYKPLKTNSHHTYWAAGTRFGDMGNSGKPGHGFDMATESDTAMDFGDSAAGPFAHHVDQEGFGCAYLSDQGRLWCFAGNRELRVTEYDIDSPRPGAGRNGSMLVPARNITASLANYAEVASNTTVGVYNRIQYFPSEKLLVLCAGTEWEVYYCRVAELPAAVETGRHSPGAASPALSCSPNPFNPAVRFTFDKNLRNSTLKIYDCSGKLAADITGRNKWDAQGRPSGVYYAVLKHGGKQRVRKLVLAR